MATGFLHTHVLVVALFLLTYLIKTILLVANKNVALDSFRRKTKIIDAVLGTLILVTGGYLLYKGGHPATWLMVKVILVIVLIPIGIIGISKGRKALAVLSLIGFFYIYAVAETRSLTLSKPTYKTVALGTVKNTDALAEAKVIYETECTRCHGIDGAAMLFGSKNLQISMLSHQETATMISAGKGTMPGFSDRLTPQQIDAVANYVATLKK